MYSCQCGKDFPTAGEYIAHLNAEHRGTEQLERRLAKFLRTLARPKE